MSRAEFNAIVTALGKLEARVADLADKFTADREITNSRRAQLEENTVKLFRELPCRRSGRRLKRCPA